MRALKSLMAFVPFSILRAEVANLAQRPCSDDICVLLGFLTGSLVAGPDGLECGNPPSSERADPTVNLISLNHSPLGNVYSHSEYLEHLHSSYHDYFGGLLAAESSQTQ